MSGIYIPGLEMPKIGETITITICDDGIVFEEWKEPGSVFKVFPVPDHGRLIDGDALNYTMLYKENWMSGTGVEAPAVWRKDIEDAPTIIPADKDGEG